MLLQCLVFGHYFKKHGILGVPPFGLQEQFYGPVPAVAVLKAVSGVVEDGTYHRPLFFLQIDYQGFGFIENLVFAVLYRTANDEGRSGLINEDAVHLVDNGKIEIPLYKVFLVKLHVVPEVIKPEFVVCAIGNVTIIGLFSISIIHTMDDHTHGEPQ